MDTHEQELNEVFAEDVLPFVHPGDESWLPYRENLMKFYDLREQHTNDFWLTPEGSAERAEYEIFNARYMEVLRHWHESIKVLRINHAQGNMISFQTAADALSLRAMERQFEA